MSVIKKKRLYRLIAGTLAASMVAPNVLVNPPMLAYAVEAACPQPHNRTGLKLKWTDIDSTAGTTLEWPRKLFFEGGDGEWASFAGKNIYCIANHAAGQPDMESEAINIKELKVSDYKDYDGNLRARTSYEPISDQDKITKFTFCLAAAAAMNAYNNTPSTDCYHKAMTTYLYALAQSMFVAIEGRMEHEGSKEHIMIKSMDMEFYINPRGGKEINATVKSQILSNRQKCFDDCWGATEVMYSGMPTKLVATKMGIKSQFKYRQKNEVVV